MINVNTVKKICREDVSTIQNYDQAVNDETQMWHCHHRLGLFIPKEKLKELGCYYNRPACELIFLTPQEHRSMHSKNRSEETRKKLSESNKGKTSGMKGKNHTEEARRKNSEAHNGRQIQQIDKKTGKVIKIWPYLSAAANELGIPSSNISHCCRGIRTSAGGFIWRYYS